MEYKKTPKSDLRKLSGMIFNLGLMLSVAAVLVAFEWKSYERVFVKDLSSQENTWDLLDIPNTIQEPPAPPPVLELPKIEAVDDDIEVDKLDDLVNFDIEDTPAPAEIIISEPPVDDIPDEIREFVEVQASFKGGMEKWYEYLKKNLNYPTQARRMGIEGTVIVRFVVNTDGSIQDIEAVRTIGGGCDEEAMDVIRNSPKWNPGRMSDRPVRSRMTMPIRFRLN
ncbi:energy transducer TonB [Algoriphagus machipongonensis]|uniref:TonB protein n=1 Tax=Algoriphagus machipongonensis TaxID=388413 RepID=A3I364_9BACT|nr:energy transducer TonB [Algoriphagus machipongonensis]EAZ79090.1 putative TonB protein [Algoriphagus machipongonensis]